MMTETVVKRLRDLIATRGTDLATVSRAIGRNHAYLGQFMNRNVPRRLPEDVREALGAHFDVDPDQFRCGPAPETRIERNGTRLDPGKLRRAIQIAERVTGQSQTEDRGVTVIEIASAVYDVLAERERSGRPVADDDDAYELIVSLLRRLRTC